jgi:acetyl-CoA synthetase
MKEGRDIWLQPLLDGASDNSVAEIMDSKLYSFYIPPVRQENRKEWFTPPLVIWFIPLILLKNFNYEENDIFWCTADIGLQVILIFCMAPY